MAAVGDVELAAILRRFEAEAAAPDSAPVAVSVTVERCGRFDHEARGASGHVVRLDEPQAFGGGGRHADPAEHLLAAVGASVSVTLTAHAALRGLALAHVRASLCAELDERSFFAPRRWPGAGLNRIRLELALAGALTERQARALVAESLRAAPVLRSLKRRPVTTWTLTREP